MNELISTRIHDHATRLALPHLAEHLDGLLARAEADTMGYRDFLDLALGEEVGVREAAASARPSSCPACPTTRASTGSTSPSNPSWTRARSATSPRWSSSPPTTTSPCSAHPLSTGLEFVSSLSATSVSDVDCRR